MAVLRGVWSHLLSLAVATTMFGCVTTEGGSAPPPIPEGKGHLILDAGGIKQLNFSVIDQETQEVVYSVAPRPSPLSPRAYTRNLRQSQTHTYLDPGVYTVVVNTDLESDTIEIPDVEIVLGEVKRVPVQLGRFMVNVVRDGARSQVRFVVYDYQMRSMLGQGMSSPQVRHFVARPGLYKIRIQMPDQQVDKRRDLKVSMGAVTPIFIELGPSASQDAGEAGASP